jgi:hypothetical protein
MGVDRGVSGSTCKVLSVTVWDMLTGFGVSKPFGEAEIDDIHVVLLLANSNEEVVWLNVSVKEVPGVHELNSLKLYL